MALITFGWRFGFTVRVFVVETLVAFDAAGLIAFILRQTVVSRFDIYFLARFVFRALRIARPEVATDALRHQALLDLFLGVFVRVMADFAALSV